MQTKKRPGNIFMTTSFIKHFEVKKMKNTLIVNLYGGPGAGKTTCAWEIASELKKRGYDVEYVSEYAKDLVYEEKFVLLDGTVAHQTLLLQGQKRRLDRLIGKVEIVVTDSPLMLSQVYVKEKDPMFLKRVRQAADQYPSFNLVVQRGKTFHQAGRIHNEQQSRDLDVAIIRMLEQNKLYYGIYDHAHIQVCVKNIERTYHRIVSQT